MYKRPGLLVFYFVVEWSREMLLEAWMEDAGACCDKCGVIPPNTVTSSGASDPNLYTGNSYLTISEHATPTQIITPPSPTETVVSSEGFLTKI